MNNSHKDVVNKSSSELLTTLFPHHISSFTSSSFLIFLISLLLSV